MPSIPMTMRVRRDRSAAPSFTLTAQTPGGGACRRTASWSGRVRRLFNRGRCTRSATWARSRSARRTRTGERRREERRTPRPPTPPCPAVSIFGWGLGEPRGSATPARARRSGGMPRGVGGRQLAPRSARENGQGGGRGSGPSRHREIRGRAPFREGGSATATPATPSPTAASCARRVSRVSGPRRRRGTGGERPCRRSPGRGLAGITALFEGVRAAPRAWNGVRAAAPACAWGGCGHDRHVDRHLWAQTINLSAQETEEDRAGGGTAGAAALALNIK